MGKKMKSLAFLLGLLFLSLVLVDNEVKAEDVDLEDSDDDGVPDDEDEDDDDDGIPDDEDDDDDGDGVLDEDEDDDEEEGDGEDNSDEGDDELQSILSFSTCYLLNLLCNLT